MSDKQLSDINKNLLTLIESIKDQNKKTNNLRLESEERREIKEKQNWIQKDLSDAKQSIANSTMIDSIKNIPNSLWGLLSGKGIDVPKLIEKQLRGTLRPSNVLKPITYPIEKLLHGIDNLGNKLQGKSSSERVKITPGEESIKQQMILISNEQENRDKLVNEHQESTSLKLNTEAVSISNHTKRTNELLEVLVEKSNTSLNNKLENSVETKLENSAETKLENSAVRDSEVIVEEIISKDSVQVAEKVGGAFLPKILRFFPKLLSTLSGKFLSIFAKIGLGAIPIIGQIFDIGTILSMIWNPIKGALYNWTRGSSFETRIVEILDSIVSPISDFFGNISDFILDILSLKSDKALDDITNAFNDLLTFLKNSSKLLSAPVIALFDGILDNIKPLFENLGIALYNGIADVVNFLYNWFENIKNKYLGQHNPVNKGLIKHKEYLNTNVLSDTASSLSKNLPTLSSNSISSTNDNGSSELTKGMSSDELSHGFGKLESEYGYQALAISAESGGNFDTIGNTKDDPGGISLGAFQFAGSGENSQRSAFINLLKENVNNFTDQNDRDLINKLDNNNIGSIIQNKDSYVRLQNILKSPLGIKLQQQLATSNFYNPMMASAANIKIGDSNLAALANSNPKLKAALFSRSLNQGGENLKNFTNKSYSSLDEFLKDYYSNGARLLSGTRNSDAVKASVQKRMNEEYSYATGGKISDFASPDTSHTSSFDNLASSISVLADTSQGSSPMLLSSIMSNPSIMKEINKASASPKSSFSNQLNIPSSSSIKSTIDDKEVEKQQLQALSAIHSSSVATDWELDSLPYDSHMAALNSGELT